MINEILQWAVLAFLAVFVLGLTRQLGNYLVPAREVVAHDNGPRVGAHLPNAVLGPDSREKLLAVMDARGSKWTLAAVLGETCESCKPWLERLSKPVPGSPAVLLLTRDCSDEYADRLRSVADAVIIGSAALDQARLRVTPFGMVLDEDLRIVDKAVAPGFDTLVQRGIAEQGELDVVHVSGGLAETHTATTGGGLHDPSTA